MADNKFSILPTHVGIIMDGNGRWAKNRGLPRSMGHIEGAKNFRRIGEYAGNLGIRHISFYAFSTENWSRPEEEVNAIMDLFGDYLREAEEKLDDNLEKGIRLRFLGDRDKLRPDLVEKMEFLENETKNMSKVHINVAVNYGGQQEILHSVKNIAEDVLSGKIKPDGITLEHIQKGLYTGEQPPVDLVIRPSGEQRLSNFLLWQSAYAEFWYSDVLWPDFTENDFDEALRAFEKRNRRFGGV